MRCDVCDFIISFYFTILDHYVTQFSSQELYWHGVRCNNNVHKQKNYDRLTLLMRSYKVPTVPSAENVMFLIHVV